MTKKKIYHTDSLELSTDTKDTIKTILLNHLVLYNTGVDFMKVHPTSDIKELEAHVLGIANSKEGVVYLKEPLLNELHYLRVKSTKGYFGKKHLNNLHYLTFRLNEGRTSTSLRFNSAWDEFTIKGVKGKIKLPRPIELDENSNGFLNLSYSNTNDRFQVNVYENN